MNVLRMGTLAWALAGVGMGLEAARAQAEPRTLLVQLSPELPAAAQQTLRLALSAQAAEVQLSLEEPHGEQRVVRVGRAGESFALGFFDADGQPLCEPRVIEGLDEVGATEVATIVHALAVAWHESAPDDAPPASTEPAAPAESSSAQLSKPQPPSSKPQDTIKWITPAARPLSAQGAADDADEPATKSVAADRVLLSALYTGSNQARQLPWQSGVRGELTYRFVMPLYVGIGYAHLPTSTLSVSTATFTMREHALSAYVGARRRVRWLELATDLALAATLTQRETTRVSAELQSTSDAQTWRPSLTWRVRARLPLGASRFALELAPAVAMNLTRHQMIIHDATETAVFTPYWLQSRIDVGVSYSAL